MSSVRDALVLLPFMSTGGTLVAYSLVMMSVAIDRAHALVGFSPFLVMGVLLIGFGMLTVVVVRRSETRELASARSHAAVW